jgi:hypothetical protein
MSRAGFPGIHTRTYTYNLVPPHRIRLFWLIILLLNVKEFSSSMWNVVFFTPSISDNCILQENETLLEGKEQIFPKKGFLEQNK